MIGLNQETFNIVWNGLKAQGWKRCGILPHNTEDELTRFKCRYHDGKGNKCAIGHLIPDEMYDPAFEGYTDDEVLKRLKHYHELDVDVTPETSWFYIELQNAHDATPRYDGKTMRDRLVDIANKYDLEIPQEAGK